MKLSALVCACNSYERIAVCEKRNAAVAPCASMFSHELTVAETRVAQRKHRRTHAPHSGRTR
eukprot:6192088-Pleurochrysis_carterae.AAC.2